MSSPDLSFLTSANNLRELGEHHALKGEVYHMPCFHTADEAVHVVVGKCAVGIISCMAWVRILVLVTFFFLRIMVSSLAIQFHLTDEMLGGGYL